MKIFTKILKNSLGLNPSNDLTFYQVTYLIQFLLLSITSQLLSYFFVKTYLNKSY